MDRVPASRQRSVQRRLQQISWPQIPTLWLLGLVTALGAGLRFYHLQALSLWLDEGISIFWSRRPWSVTLGFSDDYASAHPPLYYVLVKLAAYILPDATAGRIISAIAGIATIPILYALVARLTRPRVGLIAALLLAVSPVHIWYSQEARMYAVTVLFVALSYLALIAYYQQPRTAWAITYGLALLLAMYADYSAIYTLAPQGLLLIWILWQRRSKAWLLLAAGALAAIGYLPWLTRLFATVGEVGESREGYLGLTVDRFFISARALLGLSGSPDYLYGTAAAPWERWPAWHTPATVACIVFAVLGIFALVRYARLGLLVSTILLFGTLATAVLMTIAISPGYAERTILAATLGLAFIFAASCDERLPWWQSLVGIIGVVGLLITSGLTLQVTYEGAQKQDWRLLSDDVNTLHSAGLPIVVYPTLAKTFVEAYYPQAIQGNFTVINDNEPDPEANWDELLANVDGVPILAFAYMNINIGPIQEELKARGYERLLLHEIFHPLGVEIWAQPGARFKENQNLLPPPTVTDFKEVLDTWYLRPQTSVSEDKTAFHFAPTGQQIYVTASTQHVSPGKIYEMRFSCRNALTGGNQQMFVSSHDASGAWITVFPNGAGFQCEPGADWKSSRFLFIAPPDTVSLTIWLSATGNGSADFTSLELREIK